MLFEVVPYAIIYRMGIQTGLIVAISLCFLGVFFSIRAGVHSIQRSRRHASWPVRLKQTAAGQRYFGLAFLLLVMIIAGVVVIYTGKIPQPVLLSSPTASLVWTVTNIPSKTWTNTPTQVSTPTLTDTPTLTSTSAQTFTSTPVPSQTPLPTDTLWPTWTPSLTPTATLIISTLTPLPTSTLMPTQTPIPTDTRWPLVSPTSNK